MAFLFNPWGIVAQGFRSGQGLRESAALVDAVRLRRVRLALEVYYLEKQAYPPALAKLAESGLLRPRELRGVGRRASSPTAPASASTGSSARRDGERAGPRC